MQREFPVTDAMRRACDSALKWHCGKRAEEEQRLHEFAREENQRHSRISSAAAHFAAYRDDIFPYLSEADRKTLDGRQSALDFYLRTHRARPHGAVSFGNLGSSRKFSAGELPETPTMLGFELVHHLVRENVDANCSPMFRRHELKGFPIEGWQTIAGLVTDTFDLADGDGGEEYRNRLNAWVTRNTQNKFIFLRPWPI